MIYLDEKETSVVGTSYFYYRGKDDFGLGVPSIDKNKEVVITQSKAIEDEYTSLGYKVISLSSLAGLPTGLGIYEIFSFFFESKALDEFEMLQAIFQGIINDSSWCFCLKIGSTFCWFTLESGKLNKLGKLQFSESPSKFAVGRFIKRLRYSIVSTGINLKRVKYLCWDENDISPEFKNYFIGVDYLENFFSRIDGLKGLSCINVMKLLSTSISDNFLATAESFVDCLSASYEALGLEERDGVLYSLSTYSKDYSNCISPIINTGKCKYGIILDCEGLKNSDGSLENGIEELGGIIFCRYKGLLLNVDTFYCDKHLVNETLEQAISTLRGISNTVYKKVDVIVYGSSDEIMLKSCCKKFVVNNLRFVDCSNYLRSKICTDDNKYSLSSLAEKLSVKVVYPKHNPINDARTLFNILSGVLAKTGDFII